MTDRSMSPDLITVLATAPLHGLALLPLAAATDLDRASLFLAAAAFLVLFGFVLHAVESRFYFTGGPVVTGRDWLGGLGLMLLLAGAVAVIVPRGAASGRPLADALATWSTYSRPAAGLAVGYAAVSFMVLYCVIGSLTWPFVRRYYEGPHATLPLRVPPGPVVVGLQTARGLGATLALLPLVAGLTDTARGLGTWGLLVLPLAVTFAIVPMLQAPRDWPAALRIKHGVEIVVFVTAQGFAWWWFLVRPGTGA